MPSFRELVLALPALVLCLFVSDALFGPGRHEPIIASIAIGASWIGAEPAAERWLAKDSIVTGRAAVDAERPPAEVRPARNVTPQARIRGVFALFVPGESRAI